MNPYQALANAVVETAVKDYRTALKYHFIHPDKKAYADEVAELEAFFRSPWYSMLTDLDGNMIMQRVRCMVRREVAA